MIIKWQAVRQRQLTRLVIDVFMLVVAVANLSLILFDYSYLTLRDHYFRYVPALTQKYDRLKGIEPHRFTESYLSAASQLFGTYATLSPAERTKRQSEMVALSRQMIEDDPFARAEKTGYLELLKERIRKEMGEADSSKKAFAEFWDLKPENVAARHGYFESQLKPLIEVNFWRRIGTNGQYIDYFFFIDLFFIVVFLLEFFIMWAVAIKRHGPDQRVVYPLYHWYDVLGCMPLPQFRFLRLFRVYSIYMRLVKSDLVTIGEGPISRMMARWKEIISEELSDQVAVKILTDAQDDLRMGVTKRVFEETMLAHKDEIKASLIDSIRKLEGRVITTKHDQWVAFLTDVVEASIRDSDEYRRWSKVPFVSYQMAQWLSRESITRLVDQSLSNVAKGVYQALYTDSGEAFLDSLLDDVLDEVIVMSKDDLMQDLLQRINLKLMDEFKRSIQIKKWAQKGDLPGV